MRALEGLLFILPVRDDGVLLTFDFFLLKALGLYGKVVVLLAKLGCILHETQL